MFFTFPEDARWNAERQAVEFGSSSAGTKAWSGSHGACFNTGYRNGPLPSGVLKRTNYSEPGSSASPNASSASDS
jgi:hypothetical protein